MANKGNQKLKILYILDILKKYSDLAHPITVVQIAERLSEHGIEAERKSIYRDLHVLQEFGYAIECDDGRRGYYLDADEFELPELKLLVDAVSASRFVSEKKSRELIKKIEGLGSVYQQRQLQRQVVVADRGKGFNEKILYTIDTIYTCIDEDQMLSFQYADYNVKKELVLRHDGRVYQVSPSFLLWDHENYYLVAYDEMSKEIRHYRVDRMQHANEMETKRNPACLAVSRENYANRRFSMYAGEEYDIGMWIDEKLIGTFLDRFGMDIYMREDQDGVHVRFRAEVSPQFYGWLAGLGDQVRIEQPKEVRSAYQSFLRRILENDQM